MRRRTLNLLFVASALAMYLLSYGLLSWFGGYRLMISGHTRPPGDFAIHDTFVWQPRFGLCSPFRTMTGKDTHYIDSLGLFYFPLIWLDQTCLHRCRPYLALVGGDPAQSRSSSRPSLAEMHPISRRAIVLADTVWARHDTEYKEARARQDLTGARRIWRQADEEIECESRAQKNVWAPLESYTLTAELLRGLGFLLVLYLGTLALLTVVLSSWGTVITRREEQLGWPYGNPQPAPQFPGLTGKAFRWVEEVQQAGFTLLV